MDTSKMKESMNSFRNKMNSKRAVMASSATSDGENPAAPSDAVEEGVLTTTDLTRSSSNGAETLPTVTEQEPQQPQSGGTGGRKPKLDIKEVTRIVGGHIDNEFKCVHSNFTGTLYGGKDALVYLGQIFFFQWTLIIQWDNVMSVHKTNRGVAVRVKAPKVQYHEFEVETLAEQEKAWEWLVRLHNETVVEETSSPSKESKSAPEDEAIIRTSRSADEEDNIEAARRSFKRRNSDPTRMSQDMGSLDFSAAMSALKDDSVVTPKGKSDSEIQMSQKSTAVKRESITRVSSAPLDHDMRKSEQPKEKEAPKEAVKAPPPPSPPPVADKPANVPEKGVKDKALLKKQWSELSPKSAFSETAVENCELDCSLDAFIKTYISDEAKHSIPDYMKKNGDTQVTATNWELAKEGISQTRNIQYSHPVNAPMAPPTARARKEQKLTKYSDHGMTLETKTIVSDVPMTDCFYVADILRVEPVSDNRVKISMHFDIKFIKGTMFKGIITRTTKKEFEQFMQGMAKYMLSCTEEKEEAVEQEPEKEIKTETLPEQPQTPDSSVPKSYIYIGVGCAALLVLLQLWTLKEVSSLKSELREAIRNNDVKFGDLNFASEH